MPDSGRQNQAWTRPKSVIFHPVLSLKKKSKFSLYFHFLGSDVRDHLFRSENRLILEWRKEEKSECSLYFHYIFTLQMSDVRDFENSLFFFLREYIYKDRIDIDNPSTAHCNKAFV